MERGVEMVGVLLLTPHKRGPGNKEKPCSAPRVNPINEAEGPVFSQLTYLPSHLIRIISQIIFGPLSKDYVVRVSGHLIERFIGTDLLKIYMVAHNVARGSFLVNKYR